MTRVNTTDPAFIAEVVNERYRRNRPSELWALCLNITGDGYVVGIADANIGGYTSTHMYVNIAHYHLATIVVDEANKILFPDRDPEVTFDIRMSSMFSNR